MKVIKNIAVGMVCANMASAVFINGIKSIIDMFHATGWSIVYYALMAIIGIVLGIINFAIIGHAMQNTWTIIFKNEETEDKPIIETLDPDEDGNIDEF